MRHVQERHAQTFDIGGMAETAEGDAVVQFKNFSGLGGEPHHQCSALVRNGQNRLAFFQFRLDVTVAGGNGLHPAKRFVKHGYFLLVDSRYSAANSSSGMNR